MTTKILIAGDYCPYNRISAKIENNDFSFFEEIRDIVKSADYSIVNFECPVADEDATPIVKNGINLRTTRAAVEAIKFAGFNCATLANNHFRDFGDTGCSTTINELTSHGIDYVGGGANLHDAQKILYKVINNIKIGLLNV